MTTENVLAGSAGGGGTSRMERRAHYRWLPPRESHGRLIATGASLALWARVIDISRSGIGLLLNHRLPDGTSFTLQLRNTEKSHSYTLRGRVVHVVQIDQGAFVTGSILDDRLENSDLDVLLS